MHGGGYSLFVNERFIGTAYRTSDRYWHASQELVSNVPGFPAGQIYGCAEDVRDVVERCLEYPNVYERPYEEFIEGLSPKEKE